MSVLIYIPCHKDYEMAFANARKILTQQSLQIECLLDLRIFVSINGVESFSKPEDLPLVHVSHIREVLGADGNISKGFVLALETQPDYLWILSANEELTSEAVQNLQNVLLDNPTADLLVANAAGRHGELNLHSVFCDVPPLLALGLISGVIFRFESTKGSFLQSTLFSWTGWGQLAVIHQFLVKQTNPNLFEFPDSFLYNTPYTYSPDIQDDKSERIIVSNLYSHSFFGLPILAYCLLRSDPMSLRKFQIQWLRHNWFKIRLFTKSATFGDELVLNRSSWIRSLAEHTFSIYRFVHVQYFLAKHLPVEKVQNYALAKSFLSFYKSKL